MIGIFAADGITRNAVAYNGVSLNTLTNSAAGAKSTRSGYTVEVVAPRTAMDYVSEPNQWENMMELYGLRKNSRILVVRGFIYSTTQADLYDKVKALAAATDPSRIVFQNPSDPFLALTFTTPSAGGDVASQYNVLPIRMVEPTLASVGDGRAVPYEIDFLMREPKRFTQATTTVTGATTTTSAGDDTSWPTVTFTLSGAGSASFTITNTATYQGAKSLVLDLSAETTGNWVIDFKNKTITRSGTSRYAVYKSGDWFQIEPGLNTISYTNTTNTASRVLTYRPAWCL